MLFAALTCVAVASAIYFVLALLGAPVWLLVRPARPPLSDALACPLLGLAVLQVFAWYWLRYGNTGMAVGLPIVCGCALVAVLGVARLRKLRPRRVSAIGCAATLGLVSAVALVFVIEYRVPLRIGHLTAGSIWNADIALYANVSAALVSHGFSWVGNIVGIDLGGYASDVAGTRPGVYATLAASAAATRTATWQAALPLLLVLVVLVALAVRDGVLLLLPGRRAAAPVIALLATMASLFAYVTTNYFVSQVLVMSLAISEWAVLHWLARRPRRPDRIVGVVLIAAIVVTGTLSFTPMALLMQPVLIAVACIGELGRDWLRRCRRVVESVLWSFLVAFLLIPVPFSRSVRFSGVAFEGEGGWPLGLMTPLDILGLGRVIRTPRSMVAVFVLEAIVTGFLIAVALWLLWRRQRDVALFCAATALGVLTSYVAVYRIRGYSYSQWKWISFLQPIFIAATYTLAFAAVEAAVGSVRRVRRVTGSAVASVLAATLLVVSLRALVSDTRSTRAVWVPGAPTINWYVVRPPLSDLADRPAIASLREVNVDLPQWDAMWAAYFLQPNTRVYVVSPSYFPKSAPLARLTLVPRYGEGGPQTGVPIGYALEPRAAAVRRAP
jgi:hypothetical protein